MILPELFILLRITLATGSLVLPHEFQDGLFSGPVKYVNEIFVTQLLLEILSQC